MNVLTTLMMTSTTKPTAAEKPRSRYWKALRQR
jgi:hypothetical protein